jgi:putative transposase
MDEKKKGSSAVFNINYHIVWCTKYRRKVLNGSYATALEGIIRTTCDARGWDLIELRVMDDHIHAFLSAPPIESPTGIVKILKGVSARQMFLLYPDLRGSFWGGHLWSPSYYVGTAGHVSAEVIERYIREQCSEEQSGRRNSSTV